MSYLTGLLYKPPKSFYKPQRPHYVLPGQLNKPPGHVYELEGLLNEQLVMQYKPPARLYKPLGPVFELS